MRHAPATSRFTLAAAIVTLAGLPASLLAQPVAPLGRQPGFNQPANRPASLRKVFVDEAIGARDALTRVRELVEAENLGEAVRVLSSTLRDEGDQLLATEADPSLYQPVREVVHTMLLADQTLLNRFRVENEPGAADQLAQGDFRRVERERLLTTSGFEAALRVAQTEMESARFWSAWRVISQLQRHPDMQGQRASDALALAQQIASLLSDPHVTARVDAWAREADTKPPAVEVPVAPAVARQRAASPLDAYAAPAWDKIAPKPLQSWVFTAPPQDEEEDTAEQRLRGLVRFNAQPRQRNDATPWIFPAIVDNTVYVNDSTSIAAFDAGTLSLLWRTQPVGVVRRSVFNNWGFGIANSRSLEDIASVAVSRGVAVAVTGQPLSSTRQGDDRLHALDASTGRLKWSLDIEQLDDRLQGASLRGVPVIEGDVIVVAARRPGLLRRVTTIYMVGIDLYTGRLRWLHPMGSVGTQPWSVRGTNRADTATLHKGIVYRGDEMSVLGAYDAGLGRPLWVRVTTPIPELDAGSPIMSQRMGLPYQIVQPIAVSRESGDRLFFLEPTEQRDVIEIDAVTGKLLATRTGAELGSPEYLTRVGESLACVSNFGFSFVNLDRFADGKLLTTGTIEQVGFAGRATAMGDRLVVPIVDGLLTIDPTNPNKFDRIPLAHTGNVLVAAAEDGSASLLAAADDALYSYLPWEVARASLTARMERDATDPRPALAFIELALTQAEPALVPALADRALRIITQNPAAHEETRERLFRVLARQLAQSRTVSQDGASKAAVDLGVDAPKPISDLSLLAEFEKRLALAAQAPGERVTALFERAWLQEALQKPALSVEALQEVLADESLTTVDMTRLELPGAASDRTSAGDVATQLLAQTLTKSGPAPYALFDEEAQRAFDALPPQPTFQQLARIARQYPFAAVAPTAWQRAGDAATKAGDLVAGRQALGLGLQAAITNTRIGREGQTPLLGQLVSSLITASAGEKADIASIQPLQRLLLSLHSRTPALRVSVAGQEMSADQAADALARRFAGRTHASMASTFESTAQLLEGWEVITPLDLTRGAAPPPDLAFDAVVMISRDERRIALFAVSAIDGALTRVWEREVDVRPTVVRVGMRDTVLLWPRPGAAQLESISNLDGSVAWLAPTFSEMPAFAQGDADQRPANLGTPLDGVVRGDDIVLASDGTRAVMTERRGRCAVIDLATGKVLWAGTTGLAGVFDTEFTDTAVVFVGSKPDAATARNTPIVSCIDVATGQPRWQVQGKTLGDHARWARGLPGGDVLVGTSGGVLRLRAGDGSVAWHSSSPDVRSSLSAWVLSERTIVLNGDFDLFDISLDTGVASAKQIDVRDRLMLPFSSAIINDSLLLSSSLGLVVISGKGELAGVDALDTDASLEPALFAGENALIIETGEREPMNDDANVLASRLLLLSARDARIIREQPVVLFDSPSSMHLLDNRVIVGQGPFTIIYRAR